MNRSLSFALIVGAAITTVGIVKARTGKVTIALTPPADSTQQWDPPDVVGAYDTECPIGTVSARCAALRGAVLYQLVNALEKLSYDAEPGDAQIAAQALDIQEPEVKEAAMRVLGRSRVPGAYPKLLAILLGDPSWELQRRAADLLSASNDAKFTVVARQWQANHPEKIGVVQHPKLPALLWDETSRPAPTDVGFAAYPGTTRFTPGESDRAIAFVTKDPVDKVVAFYAQQMKVKPLDFSGWDTWTTSRQDVYYPRPDPKAQAEFIKRGQEKAERLTKLVEKYVKTKDKKLEKQIAAMQAEMEADIKAFEAALPAIEPRPGVIAVTTTRSTGSKFFVEEDQRRAVRLVVVHREDAVAGTVIQLVWDPKLVRAKPSAPPKPK